MIEFFKQWLTTVVVTVMFIVLVDMILPENNLKKYTKLVTGLIVIVTILTPVFKLFDKNENIETYINQYADKISSQEYVDVNGDAQKKFENETVKVFKENLKKQIEQEIHSQTGKKYIVSKLEIDEEPNSMNFTDVKHIELKDESKSTIKPVEKIVISNSAKPRNEEKKDENVINLLKNKFNIDASSIRFVK